MQDQLVEWFGSTGGGRALIIALVVLVVLVCWLVLPRMWNAMVGGSGLRSIRNRQPRLAVMDVAAVDNRRRLVLIRRDNVEHLILIGGPSDVVVEQTIIKGVPVGTTAGRVPRPPQTFDVPPSVSERAGDRADDERPAPERPADRRGTRSSEAVSEAAATVRALRPSSEPAPAPAPAVAESKPADARRPMARPASPLQSAPSHPAPVATATSQPAVSPAPLAASASAMAQTALSPAPVPPPPAAVPAPVAAPAMTDVPAAPAKPYVPPAPSRPAARQEPIATPPIVAEPAVAAPDIREPAPSSAAPKEPAVPFDDLAARLDEALRLDIEQPRAPAPARAPVAPVATSYPRPTRGPAAVPGAVGSAPVGSAPMTPAPVPPVVTAPPVVAAPPIAAAEPVADLPEPVDPEPPAPRSPLASASTWFRPRSNPSPATPRLEPTRLEPAGEPAPERPAASSGPERVRLEPEALGLKPMADKPAGEPDFPRVEPDSLARTDGPVAAVLPAVEAPPVRTDIGSTLADDLARILVEEPNAGSRRPEPTINFAEELAEPAPDAAPPVVVDKPAQKETARADDFTSLEDEMARLLDELAGDSNRSSRS